MTHRITIDLTSTSNDIADDQIALLWRTNRSLEAYIACFNNLSDVPDLKTGSEEELAYFALVGESFLLTKIGKLYFIGDLFASDFLERLEGKFVIILSYGKHKKIDAV